jgi:hypothetical protein
MHLYFTHVAQELNNAGLPIRETLANYKVDLDWSPETIKELVWRPIQKALLGVTSTRDLKKTEDIDRVYEHVNRFLGEKLGVHVPFPNDPDKHKEQQYISAPKTNYPTEEWKETNFD